MKIVNDKLTRSFCRPGICRWCGKKVRMLCGAHIFAKGHGGGRQIDIPSNLIALGLDAIKDCECHARSHAGHEPMFEDMMAITAIDHDCLQGDVEDLIYLIRRLPRIELMTVEKFTDAAQKFLNLGARRLAMRELETFKHLLGGLT